MTFREIRRIVVEGERRRIAEYGPRERIRAISATAADCIEVAWRRVEKGDLARAEIMRLCGASSLPREPSAHRWCRCGGWDQRHLVVGARHIRGRISRHYGAVDAAPEKPDGGRQSQGVRLTAGVPGEAGRSASGGRGRRCAPMRCADDRVSGSSAPRPSCGASPTGIVRSDPDERRMAVRESAGNGVGSEAGTHRGAHPPRASAMRTFTASSGSSTRSAAVVRGSHRRECAEVARAGGGVRCPQSGPHLHRATRRPADCPYLVSGMSHRCREARRARNIRRHRAALLPPAHRRGRLESVTVRGRPLQPPGARRHPKGSSRGTICGTSLAII